MTITGHAAMEMSNNHTERRTGTLSVMADGGNITVEAHWRVSTRWEQCDSTNVATGISERHSTFTGVLFSVSCLPHSSETNSLRTSQILIPHITETTQDI